MSLKTQSKILFFQAPVNIRNRSKLKKFIAQQFKREGYKLKSLGFVFCSDADLLRINKEFLGHSYYTDIITFDLSRKKGLIEGEIYISIDRVRDNAKLLGKSIENEFHRIVFHGTLHLCGYRDKSKVEVKKMRLKEDEYLDRYF